jgi:hypothetical protein
VSALIAGWFARLRDTVVRESLSRSAISCWFMGELMGKGGLAGFGYPFRAAARADGCGATRQTPKIEQRGWAISSSKIVVHANWVKTRHPAEMRENTEEEVRLGFPRRCYALGHAHED